GASVPPRRQRNSLSRPRNADAGCGTGSGTGGTRGRRWRRDTAETGGGGDRRGLSPFGSAEGLTEDPSAEARSTRADGVLRTYLFILQTVAAGRSPSPVRRHGRIPLTGP